MDNRRAWLANSPVRWLVALTGLAVVGGCGQPGGEPDGSASSFGTSGATSDGTEGTTSATAGGPTSEGDTTTDTGPSTGSDDATGGSVFDVGAGPDAGGRYDMCKVGEDGDAPPPCMKQAPPDSFAPEVQWEWSGVLGAITTPLVANLTDDNGDDEIDLCDIPDVVIVVGQSPPRQIHVLDGATGSEHFATDEIVTAVTPALGDIDGDGLVEIVSATPTGTLIAFENDGTKKWETVVSWPVDGNGATLAAGSAVALGDVDNDGDVEILTIGFLADHDGNELWTLPLSDGIWALSEYERIWQAPTLADLDGDQDLELVIGQSAYHHDGTVLYQAPVRAGFPQVANLDDDPFPEVLVTSASGLTMLEHDGTVKFENLTPTGDPTNYPLMWMRPATVHNLDGDAEDTAEFAMSSRAHYTAYRRDATIMWSVDVLDHTGLAAGTAFDFLGDGSAEAMYADESSLFVYDGLSGTPVLTAPRSSGTLIEYPTVADVDNDGSAEILVMSQAAPNGPQTAATVQAIRDVDDRWIQARRIWNQHTYHVTNVREDGTIPQFEKPSWEDLNTFRTNAQIEDGGVCRPQG